MVQTVPGFAIGGVGRSRYHFLVPEGDPGVPRQDPRRPQRPLRGSVVIAPSGQIAGFHQGVNLGSAAPGSRAKAKTASANVSQRGVISVKPDPRDTGKVWSLVLTAVGDIYCELEGVPPYLSLTADPWFPTGKR